jgi:hypothetical protein
MKYLLSSPPSTNFVVEFEVILRVSFRFSLGSKFDFSFGLSGLAAFAGYTGVVLPMNLIRCETYQSLGGESFLQAPSSSKYWLF